MIVQQTHPEREDSNRVKVIVSPVGRQGPSGELPDNVLTSEDLVDSPDKLEGYSFEGYGRHRTELKRSEPQLVLLQDGNILMVERAGPELGHVGNDGYLSGRISQDGGLSFGEPYEIYNDVYDDRNQIVGVLPNGNVVVVFRRYDANEGVTIDVGYILSTDNGANFGEYQVLIEQVVSAQPFGPFTTRGNRVCFLVTFRDLEDQTVRMYESTDNFETTPGFTTVVREDSSMNVTEPVLVDIGSGRSLIIARNDNRTDPGEASFYQYASENGVDFYFAGTTNMWSDLDRSVWSPAGVVYDPIRNELIVATTYRSPQYLSMQGLGNTEAKMRIYIQDADDVFENPDNYILRHELPRPEPKERRMYGYPFLLHIGPYILGAVSEEESYYLDGVAEEFTWTATFKLGKNSGAKDLLNKDISDTKVVLQNGYAEGRDYLDLLSVSRPDPVSPQESPIPEGVSVVNGIFPNELFSAPSQNAVYGALLGRGNLIDGFHKRLYSQEEASSSMVLDYVPLGGLSVFDNGIKVAQSRISLNGRVLSVEGAQDLITEYEIYTEALGSLKFLAPGYGLSDFQFGRGSGASYFDKYGVRREVGQDIIRVDYLKEGGLLIEPEATNFVTHNNSFTAPYWHLRGATLDNILDVKGINFAEFSGSSQVRTPIVLIPGGEDVVVWCYILAGRHRHISLILTSSSPWSVGRADFDLISMTPSEEHGFVNHVVDDVYQVGFRTHTFSDVDISRVAFHFDEGEATSLTLGEPQVELGITPTSPIRTSSEPVTREADTLVSEVPVGAEYIETIVDGSRIFIGEALPDTYTVPYGRIARFVIG